MTNDEKCGEVCLVPPCGHQNRTCACPETISVVYLSSKMFIHSVRSPQRQANLALIFFVAAGSRAIPFLARDDDIKGTKLMPQANRAALMEPGNWH
ncbi:hypothetical protein D6D01_05443 [Aureobasidium pullulans]|uniref:Uncharacterized protein n=1 Tax=Aureobasidium pullulans TaxID=5580 RepID=A0A4S9L779_AURPU|nr:hypothetical protein D6D01_05443 [Aureobasidium pullulans]